MEGGAPPVALRSSQHESIPSHEIETSTSTSTKNQRTNTMSPSATTIKLRMPVRVRRNLVSRLIFSATRHAASTATPATSKTTSESRAARVFTDVCIAKYSIVPPPAVLRAHEELAL